MAKKLMKTILTLGVITSMSCSLFACGAGGPSNGSGGGKTKLLVYNYNGGFGTEWLYSAEKEYEALNPDINVEVKPDKPLTNLRASDIKNSKMAVFFTEGANYSNFMAEDALCDMTDVLTTENQYDNGKKVIDKMSEQQKSFYLVSDSYYGLPHYKGNNGFIYNRQMFNDNNWYFKKERPASSIYVEDYFISSASEEKAYGPNGKTGVDYSYDDGLPATYEDFILLLKYISQNMSSEKEFSTITFTGQYREQYVGLIYDALVADYNGAEQMLLNYTFDGVATNLGKIVDGEFVQDSEPTTITQENGYELSRQAGRYYSLSFLSDVFSETAFYNKSKAVSSTDTNMDAQLRFIRGRSAILIDGNWWESESEIAGQFALFDKTKEDYDFAWMPMPKASEDKLGKSTVIDNINSLCCIRAGMSEKQTEIAKDFVKFCYSDKMLSQFTKITGAVRSLDYSVTAEDYAALTPYGKSVYTHMKNSETIMPVANNSVFRNNQADFVGREYYATNYKGYKYVSKMLLDNYIGGSKEQINAESYFNGMYGFWEDRWSAYLN